MSAQDDVNNAHARLAETIDALEHRLDAVERAIDTLQRLARDNAKRLPKFDSLNTVTKPTTESENL